MDVRTKMELAEKKEDEGAANKPIIIEDDDDDVHKGLEMPFIAVMEPRSNVGFRNHRVHQGVQNGIADIRRQQATQPPIGYEPATPRFQEIGNRVEANSFPRRTFMNRWNEPSVSQSLPGNVRRHMGMNMVNGNNNDNGRGRASPEGYDSYDFGYSSILNVPRQMVQPVGNYMVGAPEKRGPATDMEMVDAQYGYGRNNVQATNGPYFSSRVSSNGGVYGRLINVPRHSGDPDPYYVSPYRMNAGGYGNMQSIPRQSGQLRHHVSPQGTNPESHGSVANIPRYSRQPQATIAPTVAASECRNIEGAATGRSE
ncbi:cd99ecf4-b2f4-47fc-a721-9feb83e80d30-CDS [Sclerotinia trifoliorum]|uniref:Cd99ecf4-b2f4-47fc-a721-9feb83e80d30-CDS n=1 Tax=Sclerotinia trifoliorum TaxID=28548 RepID=A0A8H2VWR0_9HELO|nr:cd99ecf4-b2f4-47fc-a721-9feb83e80d30-CDS [Sclerotinia trifoliorum]